MAVALALAAVATAAAAPFLAWRIAADLNRSAQLTDAEAARQGARVARVDALAFERAAAVIPRDASYALVVPQRIPPERRSAIRHWAGWALLPRVRVAPERAEWVIRIGPRLSLERRGG